MKRFIVSLVLFLVVFIAMYLSLCYLVPGLRIKLEAEPMVYFTESIRHMMAFKCIISAIAGLIASLIPIAFKSKKTK